MENKTLLRQLFELYDISKSLGHGSEIIKIEQIIITFGLEAVKEFEEHIIK